VSGGVNPHRANRHKRTVPRVPGFAVVVLLLFASALFLGTGCASGADLVLTLQTTQDSTERQEAAADLAQKHSLASTRQLLLAAASDTTAAEGLAPLRDEYVLLLNRTIEQARAAYRELREETAIALQDIVDCLAAIGDKESLEALGALICAPERAKTESGDAGPSVPDTLELQLHALDAVAGVKADAAALLQLVEAASLSGEAISTVAVRDAAASALQARPDAVDLLFQARVAAGDDQAVCAAIDKALAGIGEPAVKTLVAAMAKEDWTDEILAQIGEPAVPLVTEKLESGNAKMRYRALGVLLRLFVTDETMVYTILVKAEMVPLLIDAHVNATYGDERDGAAETVLALIGEPAIEPLLALPVSEPWAANALAGMGATAVPALTEALKSKDRDLRFAAADVLVQIHNVEPDSVGALTSDLEDGSLDSIATNYAYYIRLGQAGTEDVLIDALNKHGDEAMAVDYLNCGNGSLEAAAHQWAAERGHDIYTEEGVYGGHQWGEGN
jgi:hypothetical protein